MNPILKLAISLAICIVGISVVTVDSQCLARYADCNPLGGPSCCNGFCIVDPEGWLQPACNCLEDSWWNGCTSATSNLCCSGTCNSYHYCGCIPTGETCRDPEHNANECCAGLTCKGGPDGYGGKIWFCAA